MSVVSPANTGRMIAGVMPSSRELRSRRQPPRGALPGDDDVALGPDVRAGGEVELGVEIVERPRALEGELRRRQAGKVGEMGEDAARGLLGIDADRQLVGRGT